MITLTAFQRSAFQEDGFQIAETVTGSGDIPWFWYAMRARRRAKQIEREEAEAARLEREQAEAAVLREPLVALRFVTAAAVPQPTTAALAKLLHRAPNEARALADFQAFMAAVVKAMDEEAL